MQGDKIMLSLVSSHYDQGVYALAHNYGSLAARLLFQPLEESGRLMFSRLAPQGGGRGEGGEKERLRTLSRLLSTLVKLVTLVGLVFACFGANYTRVLLRVLLPGKAWAEGGQAAKVLSWYCLYVLLLALNGMTEAFVYATASQAEVCTEAWSHIENACYVNVH
jgi:oligosaccharide translocation protein RFT1